MNVYAQKPKPFSFIALADLPYSIPQDYPDFEQLIAKINLQKQDFNVFLGDLKSSKTPCDDSVYLKINAYFSQFAKPLVYTPGDNEWTDCIGQSDERLDFVRELFFNDKAVVIGEDTLESQSSFQSFETFIENKSWQHKGIQFSTFHIVGSNNNWSADTSKSTSEYLNRDGANVAWLHHTFDQAIQHSSLGIVLLTHADMFTPDKGSSGFTHFLKELTLHVESYERPVLLINGDSHKYLIDKPLKSSKPPFKTLINFSRLQLFGEVDFFASIIKVNPLNPNVFEYSSYLEK